MTDETASGDSYRRSFLRRGALAWATIGVGLAGCTASDEPGGTPSPASGENGGGADAAEPPGDDEPEPSGNDEPEPPEDDEPEPSGNDGGGDGNRLFRTFVIRHVEGYENDYVGRMLSFDAVTSADTSGVPIDECEFADWAPDRTRTYDAQFLDERPSPPVSVERTVYANEADDVIAPTTHFVINGVARCPGEYVGVEAEWFVRNPSHHPPARAPRARSHR